MQRNTMAHSSLWAVHMLEQYNTSFKKLTINGVNFPNSDTIVPTQLEVESCCGNRSTPTIFLCVYVVQETNSKVPNNLLPCTFVLFYLTWFAAL